MDHFLHCGTHAERLDETTEGKMRLGDRVEVPDPATWRPPPDLDQSPLVQFGFSPHTVNFEPMGQYNIPRFIEGGITAQVCAIYLADDKLSDPLSHGLQMTWQVHHAAATYKNFELVATTERVLRVKQEGKVGVILSFEGCEALGSEPRFLYLYYKLGLRIASLTHARGSIFAEGSYCDDKIGGLTELGKQLIKSMNELGIVVDLAHINQPGFWNILETTNSPAILSHSTPTMFPNSDPNEKGPLCRKISRPRLVLPLWERGDQVVPNYKLASLLSILSDEDPWLHAGGVLLGQALMTNNGTAAESDKMDLALNEINRNLINQPKPNQIPLFGKRR